MVHWKLSDELVVLKAEMVVAVRCLGLAAGFDDVDLGGNLVIGAQPGRREECQDGVGIVVDEGCGVFCADFLHRVPNSVVGTGFGEVVAAVIAAGFFLGDNLGEKRGIAVEDGGVGVRVLYNQQAGTVFETVVEFGFDGHFVGGEQINCVVEDGVLRDGVGGGIVGKGGPTGTKGGKLLQVEVLSSAKGGGHIVAVFRLSCSGPTGRARRVLLPDLRLRVRC